MLDALSDVRYSLVFKKYLENGTKMGSVSNSPYLREICCSAVIASGSAAILYNTLDSGDCRATARNDEFAEINVH